MDNRLLQRAKDASPERAYKFIFEAMPADATAALDKALRAGATPEDIARFIVGHSSMKSRSPQLKPAIKIYAAKALEHRKWLLDQGIFDKEGT